MTVVTHNKTQLPYSTVRTRTYKWGTCHYSNGRVVPYTEAWFKTRKAAGAYSTDMVQSRRWEAAVSMT